MHCLPVLSVMQRMITVGTSLWGRRNTVWGQILSAVSSQPFNKSLWQKWEKMDGPGKIRIPEITDNSNSIWSKLYFEKHWEFAPIPKTQRPHLTSSLFKCIVKDNSTCTASHPNSSQVLSSPPPQDAVYLVQSLPTWGRSRWNLVTRCFFQPCFTSSL